MILKHDCITCKVRDCSILRFCDDDTLTAISTYKISKLIQKGDRLFSEGDPVMGVYFIKKGFLKIELNGKQGRPLILTLAGKGTVLGHRTNAEHPYHTVSATALTNIEYCYVAAGQFGEIKGKSPVLAGQILNQILNELDMVQKKTVNIAHKSVREKVAEALLLLSKWYEYEQKKQSFRIHFCRQDIADFSGTTREQVSKTLKDFEKEKLIKCTAKKFTYLNTELLRKIAESHTPPV